MMLAAFNGFRPSNVMQECRGLKDPALRDFESMQRVELIENLQRQTRHMFDMRWFFVSLQHDHTDFFDGFLKRSFRFVLHDRETRGETNFTRLFCCCQ